MPPTKKRKHKGFESYSEPVLPFKHWLGRVGRSLLLAGMVAVLSLAIGVFGYHFIGKLGWVDAILEASMILGGMGPVAPLQTNAVKLFASAYALYSGLVLIGTTGILLAPWLHRFLHRLHAGDGR